MINKKKQEGATFITWMIGISIIGFVAITGIKLAPVYLQYNSIKGIVDELASNPSTKKANKRMLRVAIDRRLNINALDDQLSSMNFELIKVKGSKGRRKIRVKYDIQKPWFANLDFIAKFDYSKEIGID